MMKSVLWLAHWFSFELFSCILQFLTIWIISFSADVEWDEIKLTEETDNSLLSEGQLQVQLWAQIRGQIRGLPEQTLKSPTSKIDRSVKILRNNHDKSCLYLFPFNSIEFHWKAKIRVKVKPVPGRENIWFCQREVSMSVSGFFTFRQLSQHRLQSRTTCAPGPGQADQTTGWHVPLLSDITYIQVSHSKRNHKSSSFEYYVSYWEGRVTSLQEIFCSCIATEP